jgi:glycosyltransferase involved in cell wall biosynthesis
VRGVLTGRHPTVVLGAGEAALFTEVAKHAHVTTLANCVDLEHARKVDRDFASTDMVALLFMGRIAPGKGLDIVCEAVRILCERGCRIKFVLAGAGPDEARYVARLHELLGPDFMFAGVVSGYEKSLLLSKCDVFVLPSLFEGLPMALLESMAFGLVPITTNVGSMGEVVTSGENGVLLRNHSPGELADAVEMIASDPSMRERLSRNATAFVFEHHDPVRYVTRLNEIYQYE